MTDSLELSTFKQLVRLQYMFQLRLQRVVSLEEAMVLFEKEKEPRFCFKSGFTDMEGNKVMNVCTECGVWHPEEKCK